MTKKILKYFCDICKEEITEEQAQYSENRVINAGHRAYVVPMYGTKYTDANAFMVDDGCTRIKQFEHLCTNCEKVIANAVLSRYKNYDPRYTEEEED